jgi:hypothetical protein
MTILRESAEIRPFRGLARLMLSIPAQGFRLTRELEK